VLAHERSSADAAHRFCDRPAVFFVFPPVLDVFAAVEASPTRRFQRQRGIMHKGNRSVFDVLDEAIAPLLAKKDDSSEAGRYCSNGVRRCHDVGFFFNAKTGTIGE